MKPRGVHHVSLNVRDVEEAREFYTKVLGFEEAERPDFGFPGLWLQAGAQQIHLMGVEAHEPPLRGQHFALWVDDLDEAVADLASRGLEPRARFEFPGAGRQAFFRDPSGNLIELNQPDS